MHTTASVLPCQTALHWTSSTPAAVGGWLVERPSDRAGIVQRLDRTDIRRCREGPTEQSSLAPSRRYYGLLGRIRFFHGDNFAGGAHLQGDGDLQIVIHIQSDCGAAFGLEAFDLNHQREGCRSQIGEGEEAFVGGVDGSDETISFAGQRDSRGADDRESGRLWGCVLDVEAVR